ALPIFEVLLAVNHRRSTVNLPFIVLAPALDLDADVARVPNRAALVQAHLHPAHAELGDDDLGDAFGQRLDEVKIGGADESDDALCDLLVVEGIFDAIRARRFADVGRHLEIDDDGLLDSPLPLPDADDALERVCAEVDFVHARVG